MTKIGRTARAAVLVGAFLGLAIGAVARADAPPQQSSDGLDLVKQTATRLVYKRPGADFSQYKRVAILDCGVEFSKDWINDYNSSQVDPSRRIGQQDIDRAKASLAEQFKKIFSDELSGNGGYAISQYAGADVLVLRPALVNIQVSAPDLMAPGRSATFVQQSGQMTLYLELWDSTSNTILARILDAQGSGGFGGQRATSVSNMAAAQQIMQSWADELRKRLDIATGKSAD